MSYTGIVYEINGHYLIRPSGLFTEPGALGVQILLALLLNKVSLNSKRIELFLIISGLFTLSFGFYISIIIYVIVFFTKKQLLNIAIIVFVFVSVVFINQEHIYILTTLEDLFFSRFSFGDSGLIGATTRSSMNSEAMNILETAPFFGVIVPGYTHPSIGGFFAEHGIFGATILLMHLVLLVIIFFDFANKHKKFLLIMIPILIIINLYHRPFVNRVFYELQTRRSN
jgi:hypothetical protein